MQLPIFYGCTPPFVMWLPFKSRYAAYIPVLLDWALSVCSVLVVPLAL